MKKSFSVPTNVLSKNWLNCPHLIDNSFMLIQLNGMYQLYEYIGKLGTQFFNLQRFQQ